MFKNSKELKSFLSINSHAESRSCEFKTGVAWSGDFRLKIVRAILAMSNLRGGGPIIIGIEWDSSHNSYKPVGMNKSDANTYDHEVILELANVYADPFVQVEVKHFKISNKWIVVIQVAEFFETPIICKKSFGRILKEGNVYYRTHKKPESSPNLSYVDTKEILDHAITKGLSKEFKRLEDAGLKLDKTPKKKSDKEKFDKEVEEFD